MKVITIGRSSTNDITINDPKVSRHHCQIVQYDDGSYGIVDFGSTNGTYVNGRRVYGGVRLNTNDEVRIGSNTLQWERYFNSVGSPKYPQKKSSALPIILGVVGGVLTLVVIALLLILRNSTNDNNITTIQPVSNSSSISSPTTKKALSEQRNEKQYSVSKQDFYLKFKDNESFTLGDGTILNASLTTMGLGDLWLKISWQGKTPLKIIWKLNSYGLAPTSGELYATKSYDMYSIHKTISDFQWVEPSADV